MMQHDEQAILGFLKQEAIAGKFESTIAEIAGGVKLSYNQVARILERLMMMGEVAYRERGTERKMVRYFFLKALHDLFREKCSQGEKMDV